MLSAPSSPTRKREAPDPDPHVAHAFESLSRPTFAAPSTEQRPPEAKRHRRNPSPPVDVMSSTLEAQSSALLSLLGVPSTPSVTSSASASAAPSFAAAAAGGPGGGGGVAAAQAHAHAMGAAAGIVDPPPQPQPDLTRILREFACPITLELPSDPVLAEDGHTYERAAIEGYISRSTPRSVDDKKRRFKSGDDEDDEEDDASRESTERPRERLLRSPVTMSLMGPTLIPNVQVKSAIALLVGAGIIPPPSPSPSNILSTAFASTAAAQQQPQHRAHHHHHSFASSHQVPPPHRARSSHAAAAALSSNSSTATVAVSMSSSRARSAAHRDSLLVRSVRSRAQSGDPEAMHDIGTYHYRGLHGLRRDKRRGYRWFRRAADAGSVRGMAACGALVLNGAECTEETGEEEETERTSTSTSTGARAETGATANASATRAEASQEGATSAAEEESARSSKGSSRQPRRHHSSHRHHHHSHSSSHRRSHSRSSSHRRPPNPSRLDGMALLGVAAASGSALAAFWLGQCYLEGSYGLPANPRRARMWLERVVRDECDVRDLDSGLRGRAGELLEELDDMEEEEAEQQEEEQQHEQQQASASQRSGEEEEGSGKEGTSEEGEGGTDGEEGSGGDE